MSKSLIRGVYAGVLVLGLTTTLAASGFAQNRTNANTNGGAAVDRDTGHNRAQDRQAQTRTNTNANSKTASDRDTGLNRAQDRMSPNGIDNSKAGAATTTDRDLKGDAMSKGTPAKGHK